MSCGESSACPDDQFCLADGKCHASQDEALCTPGSGDASADADPGDGGLADDLSDSDDSGDSGDDPGDDPGDEGDADPDGGDPDGGPPDASIIDASSPVTPDSPGDLVITEIHRDPTAAQDPAGEWFEVFNPTEQTFDLLGLRIRDLDTDVFDIDSSVIVPPGGRVVFARIASPDENGGVPEVTYAYEELYALGNVEDEIVIQNIEEGVELDRVVYSFDFPRAEGTALSLDPDQQDATSNDDPSNWCEAQFPYGDGDLGTPGVANPDC